MIDSEFWRRLATQFDAITTDPLRLRAEWCADGFDSTSTQWRIAGFDPDVEPFKQLARLAAVALGETDGPDAWAAWLRRLSLDSSDFQASPLALARDVVQGIGDLSARFCRQLAVDLDVRALRRVARTPPVFPRRATWVRAKLADREQNAHRFAALSGIEHRVVKKILDGANVRDDVLTKLAAALGCSARDIPSD